MTPDQKEWIDTADYETLLKKWRFSPAGDIMFQGDTGEYFSKVMREKQSLISQSDYSRISKRIGWGD